ncbi:MAG: DUF2829 domain-containing protein [Eubacteriales bacterium]
MTYKAELLEALANIPDEDMSKATVKLSIHMPTGEIEIITNPNIRAKGAYIERAYDDELHLKTCNDIFITDYEVRVDYRVGISFGAAVKLLKEGYKARRLGWNGKGMWIRIYNPYEDKEFPIREINPCEGTPISWIGMKTADNKFVPWLASQTDILSEDWEIIEFPHPISRA